MGRPLFSSHARAPAVAVAPDHEHGSDREHATAGAHTHYEKWTYGAFDPDSDEFFEGAVYEAFLGPEDAINVSPADRDRDPEADADSQHEHELGLDADDLPGGWGRRIRMLSPSERVLRLNELVSRASAIRTAGDHPTTILTPAAEYFVPAAASPTTTTTTTTTSSSSSSSSSTSAGGSAPASPTQRARVHTSDITPIPLPSSVARAHLPPPPPPREQSVDPATDPAAGTGAGTGAAYFVWPFPSAAALPRQPGEPPRVHLPAARGPRWPVY